VEFIPADDEKGPGLRLRDKVRGKRVKRVGMRGKSDLSEALPPHNLQAFDLQILDSRIVRNQDRAKSFGVGRNYDVKRSRTPPETLGIDPNSGMGLGCGFIPWVN